MTQVEVLLTFWPPWPPERTKVSSMSASRTPNAAMRCVSWASFSGLTGNALISPTVTGVHDRRQVFIPPPDDKRLLFQTGGGDAGCIHHFINSRCQFIT